ncbi:MAG: tape measure protein [Clostridia bacterium]
MNENQLDNLLKIAAKRMGTTPEALKKAAENGEMSNIVGNGKESEMISKVLSDPQAAQKLLSTPQAQQLLKMFGQK